MVCPLWFTLGIGRLSFLISDHVSVLVWFPEIPQFSLSSLLKRESDNLGIYIINSLSFHAVQQLYTPIVKVRQVTATSTPIVTQVHNELLVVSEG